MNNKVKIAFFDVKEQDYIFLKANEPENAEFIFVKDTFEDSLEKNFDKVKDAQVISVFTTSKLPNDKLAKFKNLKMVSTRSTGYNHIDIEYCKQNNIAVVNVPSYGDCTVAEFAFALLLNVTRKVIDANQKLKEGIVNVQGYVGTDLFEKTIGIIGTGAIGCHAASIACGFGMKVLAFDPKPNQELVEKLGVNYLTLDELYKESDIITLHCPANKQTHHMINDDAFNKMKKGVIIINTARGEVVDTEALYRAIKNKIVAGAGLDVLECENLIMQEDHLFGKIDCINQECLQKTLINHKLLDMPNVIVTPHVAFDSKEAVGRILATTAKNIQGFLNGKIINKVN